ncbi:MAG: insulinase family protein [Hyphomonadaceae bacterium]
MAELMAGVDVPYESFTPRQWAYGAGARGPADRGDRGLEANIGSKDEPEGQTGFAHLFEHIMLFNGTEHIPNLIEPLRDMGATNWNGTTWSDRTNYFQTVPTPALDRALYIESERMGYILGALTQERLDAQRGIVQNEKRQGDNQPYGLTSIASSNGSSRRGIHRHSTIGSMADLDAASLSEDVRQWFGRQLRAEQRGDRAGGRHRRGRSAAADAALFRPDSAWASEHSCRSRTPTLAAPISETMHDRVSNTRLYRTWVVPGLRTKIRLDLNIAAQVLGGWPVRASTVRWSAMNRPRSACRRACCRSSA